MPRLTPRFLFGAAVVAVNVALASSPAEAGREYEVAKLPDGSPIIVCEGCWFWGCDCPDVTQPT